MPSTAAPHVRPRSGQAGEKHAVKPSPRPSQTRRWHNISWLSAAARTLSLKTIYARFCGLRWPETHGAPVCPRCAARKAYALAIGRDRHPRQRGEGRIGSSTIAMHGAFLQDGIERDLAFRKLRCLHGSLARPCSDSDAKLEKSSSDRSSFEGAGQVDQEVFIKRPLPEPEPNAGQPKSKVRKNLNNTKSRDTGQGQAQHDASN